jgi:hypothetical protein
MVSAPLRLSALCGLLVLSLLAAPGAQTSPEQPTDPDFAAAVKEWTTAPEFSSPLVDHLPLAQGIPTPKDVLGYHIGVPRRLTSTADALRYYRALEQASPRIKVTTVGQTDEGREINVVYFGDAETLKELERHRLNHAKLADPRGLSAEEAQRIIGDTKPIYHLTTGLHSAETGPPEMALELAYRLVAGESALVRQIRDRIIVSLTPATDPDGRDRYVDWYRLHMVDIEREQDRITGPPYWGKYIFHDNNRDINYSQKTMRALLDWYLQWHPPIWHDLHESVPFLYTFSGQAPQNPNLDPIVYGELPMFANFEMAQLTKYGMPGVWTHAFVDMWSPGYLGFMSSNHNGLLRMYETFGNGGATTMKRTVAQPDGPAGQTSREWYRPLPPYREVLWSMRNNTNYMQTGVLTALQYASAFPHVILENFYLKSRNSIEAGRTQPPHGFIVPAGQADPTRVNLLISLLRRQGIEVGMTSAELQLSDGTYAAGSLVIKRDQPYGRLAKTLLEKQTLPDPNLRTYDDTGWTMGLMLQVDVKATSDAKVLEAATTLVDALPATKAPAARPGTVAWVVPHHGANTMVTLRHRLKDLDVVAATAAFTVGQRKVPAGSFIVSVPQGSSTTLSGVAGTVHELGLDAFAVAARPDVATRPVVLPRLAMFSTWGSTQEVGWVRHAFDTFEVAYDLVYKERIREGNLRAAYDVILIPNQGRGGAKSLVFDVPSKGTPLPYKKDPAFPSLGAYGESDDITGGMGLEGVLELQQFVRDGGVLITLGVASFFPADFGLLQDVTATRPSAAFYAPGPVVEAEIAEPAHPIFFGYARATLPVRYANGPLLQVPREQEAGQVLMRFTGGDGAVLSGLMRGAAEIRRRPAILDTPVGKGRIVTFATNPCYRWQNHGEFGMLFNAAVLFWQTGDPPARGALRRAKR